MKSKADTRVCKYSHCEHTDKIINVKSEKYIKDGNCYYHEDCYRNKTNIQLIKNLWCEHISSTVVYSQLMNILNQLIFKNDIPSEYILFVVEYCIKNRMNLRYPPGLKYYVDNQAIKDAYNKRTRPIVRYSDFSATDSEDKSPKFTINKKNEGFKSILGG